MGVVSLLIWTAGIGAYLAVVRGLAPQQPRPPGMLGVCALALGVGTAWAGLVILAWRAAQGARGPVEPGHWLLALVGTGSLVDVLLRIAPEALFARPDLVLNAIVCWLFVLPLLSQRLPTRWKGFFLLIVMLYAAPLLLGCFGMLGLQQMTAHPRLAAALNFAAEPVAAGSLITTCVLDRRDGRRQDWLHWCGVFVFLWLTLLRIVMVGPS